MDKIINNLPSTYKKDSWVQTLMQSAQLQLESLEADAIQLGNELMLNLTSEKQLTVEEMLCGFDVGEKDSIISRKANVSAKWKVKPIITLDTLQAIANSWSDNIIATYPNAEYLKLDFSSSVEAYPKMLESIREAMPAHIPLFASVLYDFPDNPVYIGSTVQIADMVNISTKSDIDITINYFGTITQIADFIDISSNEVI